MLSVLLHGLALGSLQLDLVIQRPPCKAKPGFRVSVSYQSTAEAQNDALLRSATYSPHVVRSTLTTVGQAIVILAE